MDLAIASPTSVLVSSSQTRADAPGSSGSLTKPPIASMRSLSPGESGFYSTSACVSVTHKGAAQSRGECLRCVLVGSWYLRAPEREGEQARI